jgi:hypothetical protein
MMFALLTASYVLAVVTAEPCISEVDVSPDKSKTVIYKCVPRENRIPELLANPFKMPPVEEKDD